jgi:hypothetical protein
MSSVIKERPIVFGPIVRAILDGSKTQERRLAQHPLAQAAVRVNSYKNQSEFDCILPNGTGGIIQCPHGKPGERLWVCEEFCVFPEDAPDGMGHNVYYRADDCNLSDAALEAMRRNSVKWRPSVDMPRTASRILLEITDVRVQRLQEISEEDAWAEGCDPYDLNSIEWFRAMWEPDNGTGSWDANPWVWAISFRRLKQ